AVLPPSGLPTLLREADVLVLSCPHTPETEGLIGAEELAMLKPGAVLINIARGAVVDEPALIDALRSGRLGAAALDVAAEEPLPAGSPLWRSEERRVGKEWRARGTREDTERGVESSHARRP